MARKDDMLRAFLKNQDFCVKYKISQNQDLKISEAQSSDSPALIALAKIINKYEEENNTPLYQQVVNILNEKL